MQFRRPSALTIAGIEVVTAWSSLGHHRMVLTGEETRQALRGLVRAVHEADTQTRQDGVAWLLGRSGREWLVLDDNARESIWQDPIVSGSGWSGQEVWDDTGLTDAVASWHVDGRVRQRAVWRLAGRPGAVRAACLAVRCLDHVEQVRHDALAGVLLQTNGDAVDAVVGVLTAGAARIAARPTLEAYTDQLLLTSGGGEKVMRCRTHPDRGVRRWAVTTALGRRLFSADQVLELFRTDVDQLIRARCADWLADGPPELLARLLSARFVEGRLAALRHIPDRLLSDSELRDALLDRSPRVRALAQSRSHQRGADAAEVYRGELFGSGPRETAIALAGLASTGTAQDGLSVRSFLTHDRPVVRASAVAALTALAVPAEVLPLVTPLLMDPSSRVITAAAKALTRVSAGADVTATAWASDRPASRNAAWRVQRATRGWNRVEADLRAASDHDAEMAESGRLGLQDWLHNGAATTWSQPTPPQLATIATLLPRSGLTADASRQLAFHAGLPWNTEGHGSEPSPEVQQPPSKPWWQRLTGL